MRSTSAVLPRTRGFTLIDMMVAIALLGILSAIALPSYQSAVRKSRRADALQSLRSLQVAQERWRANNPTYGALSDLGISATTSGGYYTLAISNPTATTYTATATAIAGNSQTSDTSAGVSCSTLTVNQDAPVFSPSGQSSCWGQ